MDNSKIQAIFPRDKETLDILWNKYINKVILCFDYADGHTEVEYKNYKTLECPFKVIQFGDMVYETLDGTTDNMIFQPVNCPYHFIHTFNAKEGEEIDYTNYALTSIETNWDFRRFVKENPQMLRQFAFESTMLYLMILYMSEKPEYIQSEEIPSWKAKQDENNKDRKNDYKYTKVVKKYSVFKNKEEKQHYQIQCPVWSVRGHYRHYKNGKVVFVNSYNKGKNRDKEEPETKIYKIDGE